LLWQGFQSLLALALVCLAHSHRRGRRVVNGRIEIREYLCVTISFDHDVVDGAPAARFTRQFKELIERGYGLCAQDFGGGHTV